ncbi:MAG: permease [Lysobacterales bacterium]|nr:MAG: permease [Xanthomonadales bacterium]
MEDAVVRYALTVWAITVESAPWVVVSLVFGGLIREFLPASGLQRLVNRRGIAGMGGAVTLGALLPICSCGVVPLAISLYRAGVRIGPVMAFTAATPIINPAAVILAFGLLGPELTVAYIALGLTLPFLLGLAAERWGGAQIIVPDQPPAEGAAAGSPRGTGHRILQGLRWGILELGPMVGFYLAIGILLAAAVMVAIPHAWLEQYLGGDAVLSLLVVGVLGAAIYVCAVAHIPLVATLLAAGAAPGAAVVFLLTGTATNLPELIALYKTIGRRVVVLYVSMLVALSILAGLAINAWLLPGFEPVFDPLRGLDALERSAQFSPSGTGFFTLAAAVAVALLALAGLFQRLRQRFARPASAPATADVDAGCSCCQHHKIQP